MYSQVTVEVIADSLTEAGVRGTTLKLRYPRFIHAEFMTHRMFARNASSSRAIPVEKMIEQVENEPAIPVRWGREGKGMQDHGELLPIDQEYCLDKWLEARDHAVMIAKDLIRMPERPHKQVVNRLLEPWQFITVLCTSTDYGNFVHLRDHKDADPTMGLLGKLVHEAMLKSTPRPLKHYDYHLPFVSEADIEDLAVGTQDSDEVIKKAIQVSVARCARVSYNNFDGTRSTYEQDKALYKRLVGSKPMHASPTEHQFCPDRFIGGRWENPELHGCLEGVIQFRKTLHGECEYNNFID